MVLTGAQFFALFVFSCLSGVFTGLTVSLFWGVWGGIKPLARRLNDVEADLGGLTGRFATHQKRVAGEKSAIVREENKKVPKEIEQLLMLQQQNAGKEEGEELRYVG